MENKLKVRGGNTYKSKTNAQSNYNWISHKLREMKTRLIMFQAYHLLLWLPKNKVKLSELYFRCNSMINGNSLSFTKMERITVVFPVQQKIKFHDGNSIYTKY
jgi:hypothetical protein